jgi:hypothetical protein
MNTPHLAIADADRIHDYVFGPRALKLIRGASALQTELNKTILPGIAVKWHGECISAAGGTVLAKFPGEDEAQGFAREAEAEFLKQTAIATLSTAIAPYPTGQFKDALETVREHLETKKQARAQHRFDGGRPYWRSCDACGVHPASERLPDQALCRGCYIRMNSSNPTLFYPPGIEPAEHLEAIAEKAKPLGYLAMVYLDLDRLGKLFAEKAAASETTYALLSTALDKAVRESVRAVCESLMPSVEQAGYEILLMGGDDAVVALPAQHGLRFAAQFQKEFGDRFRKSAPPGFDVPKFSTGVLFAHHHFPISEFLRHAEDLQKSAKTLAEKDAIDYEILTSSLARGIREERREITWRGKGFARTMKPYTVTEIEDLLRQVGKLKGSLGSSRANRLYEIAFQEPEQAEFEYLTLLWRLDEPGKSDLIDAVGTRLWAERPDGTKATKAADIAEIWGFANEAQD